MIRRYGWIAVLVVLALVGGAAWNEWRKARDAAQAQGLGDAMIAALEANESDARVFPVYARSNLHTLGRRGSPRPSS
jgi:hypothetical protein